MCARSPVLSGLQISVVTAPLFCIPTAQGHSTLRLGVAKSCLKLFDMLTIRIGLSGVCAAACRKGKCTGGRSRATAAAAVAAAVMPGRHWTGVS